MKTYGRSPDEIRHMMAQAARITERLSPPLAGDTRFNYSQRPEDTEPQKTGMVVRLHPQAFE